MKIFSGVGAPAGTLKIFTPIQAIAVVAPQSVLTGMQFRVTLVNSQTSFSDEIIPLTPWETLAKIGVMTNGAYIKASEDNSIPCRFSIPLHPTRSLNLNDNLYIQIEVQGGTFGNTEWSMYGVERAGLAPLGQYMKYNKMSLGVGEQIKRYLVGANTDAFLPVTGALDIVRVNYTQNGQVQSCVLGVNEMIALGLVESDALNWSFDTECEGFVASPGLGIASDGICHIMLRGTDIQADSIEVSRGDGYQSVGYEFFTFEMRN